MENNNNFYTQFCLVITVFCNFYRAAYVCFETTLYPALIFDYNEKLSAEWVSF